MTAGYALMMMVLGAATAVVVGASGVYVSCEADHECEKNKFCYEPSGLCVPCTDCEVFNRQKPVIYPKCPKVPLDCGECLPGYQEEIFTGRDVRHQCIRIASPAKNGSHMPWVVPVFIVVGILLASICGAGIYRFACQRFWRKEPHQSVREEIALEDLSPPPYCGAPLLEETHAATPFSTSDFVSEVRSTHFEYHEEKEDKPLQRAVPFRDADTPYQNSEEQEELPGGVYIMLESPEEQEELPEDFLPIQEEETVDLCTLEPGYEQQASVRDGNDSDNEADNNEVAVSSEPAHLVIAHDSGLSDSSCEASSSSLPQRPFEGLGSSSGSSLSFQQPLSTTRTRRYSDEDVSTDDRFHKRARCDSGTQSLEEGAGSVNKEQ